MPKTGRPKSARGLREDAIFDLHDQLPELKAIADELAHVLRRIAVVNRLRTQAVGSLRSAQNVESDAAISPMSTWNPSEVAA